MTLSADLLDLNELYTVPGMMQSGPEMPPAKLDLRLPGENPTGRMYWDRAEVEAWLHSHQFPNRPRRANRGRLAAAC